MDEANKNPAPAGQTAPAGAGKVSQDTAETTWARSRLEWTCLNALEMKRRELMGVLRDLDAAADRLRGRM